jgi:hypothetical protein
VRLRRISVLVILLGGLMIPNAAAPPVAEAVCPGVWWANGSWSYNRYVSDGCETVAEFVRGIQLITNETAPYPACPAGTVDGYWGPNTKNGVKCMQTRWGITADGIVGPSTWSHYRFEITQYDITGGFAWYKTDWVWSRFSQSTSTNYYYVWQACAPGGQHVGFWTDGPNTTECQT